MFAKSKVRKSCVKKGDSGCYFVSLHQLGQNPLCHTGEIKHRVHLKLQAVGISEIQDSSLQRLLRLQSILCLLYRIENKKFIRKNELLHRLVHRKIELRDTRDHFCRLPFQVCVMLKALLDCAIFSATCLAISLQDELPENCTV